MRATTVFVLAIVVAIFAMSLEAATTTKKAATTTKKATTTTKKTTVKTTTKTTTKAATTTKATTTTPTTTTTSTTTTTTTTTPTTTTTSPPWCPVVDPGCPYVPLPSSDFTTPEEVETTETITAEWTTETETPSTEPEVKTSTASSGPWCPVPEPGCPYVPLPSTDITVEWSFETVSFSPEVPPTITVPEVEASTGGSTPCFCPVPEPGCPYVPLPSTDFTVEWSLETVSFSPEVPPTITLPEVEVSTGGGGSVPCWCPQPEPGCPYVPLPSSDFPGTPEGYTFPPGWTFEIETATFPEFSWPPDVSFSPELPPTITVPELPWCPVPEPGCPYVPLPSTGSPGWDDFTGTFSDYTVEPGICSICVAPLQFLAVNEGARSFSSIIFDKTVDGYQTLTLICPSNDAFSYSQIEFNAGGNGINNGITGSVAEATLVCNGTNWFLDAYVVTQVECDSTPPLELTTPQD